MPSTTKLEILQGQEAGEAASSNPPASSPTPPNPGGEASGRSTVTRVMECWNCHGLTYVEFDADAYHLYTCCHCQAANRF